jgi:hypothetical protein
MGVMTAGRYTFGNKTKADIVGLTEGVSKTGTLTSTGTSLSGSGTLFTTELQVGDVISCSAETAVIASITDNTTATLQAAPLTDFSAESYQLVNPKRIKRGASVFNTTDRIAMYYTGDDEDLWTKGEFCSGQAIPMRNAYGNSSLTEGEVLEPSGSVNYGMVDYDGTIDHALGVAYHTVQAGCCCPLAVVGVHNTDANGTITKGNFVVPSVSTSDVTDDGTTESSDQCGVAMTSDGTPTTGEIEMLVNFLERI